MLIPEPQCLVKETVLEILCSGWDAAVWFANGRDENMKSSGTLLLVI